MEHDFDEAYFATHDIEGDDPPFPEIVLDHKPIITHPPNPADFSIISISDKGVMRFNPAGMVAYLRACNIIFEGAIPHRFDGRIYKEMTKRELDRVIYRAANISNSSYVPTPYEVNTVIKAVSNLLTADIVGFPLDLDLGFDPAEYDGELLAFENGILNLTSRRLLDFTPFIFLTNIIHARYDPSITDCSAKAVLTGIIPQGETLDFLFEMIGYILFSNMNPPAIFCIYGPGGTGKSAIAHMIRTLLRGSTSEIGFTQLTSKFTVAELEGKVLNICGETGDESSKVTHFDGELMKRLSDGDEVLVERKGQDPYYIRNTAKFLFVTNSIPDFGDNSSGLYRRLYVIPCREKQDPKKMIYDLLADPQSLSWVVNRSLEAYNLFKDRRTFNISPGMEVELTQFKSQNSLLDFVQQIFGTTEPGVVAHEIADDSTLRYTVELYEKYSEFCRDAQCHAYSRKTFVEKVRNEFKLKTKTDPWKKLDGSYSTRTIYYIG